MMLLKNYKESHLHAQIKMPKGGLLNNYLNTVFRGKLGRFFTRREIVEFMVEVIACAVFDRFKRQPSSSPGRALTRFIKRIVEREIFTTVLDQAGFDPKQVECRLRWGMPEALDYEKLATLLPYLMELQLNAVIKTREIRSILRDVYKLPLEEIEHSEFVAGQPVTAE